jgi:hypothetical protein
MKSNDRSWVNNWGSWFCCGPKWQINHGREKVFFLVIFEILPKSLLFLQTRWVSGQKWHDIYKVLKCPGSIK